MSDRFLTREQVADELNISMALAYALIRRRELRALKLGGGHGSAWRIGRDDLEDFIQRTYGDTAHWISAHPFNEDDATAPAS